jgi:hypothetical protein
VLDIAATLHAVRTLDRRSPRMVKRRNSPYASFDRGAPRRIKVDFAAVILTSGRREPLQY